MFVSELASWSERSDADSQDMISGLTQTVPTTSAANRITESAQRVLLAGTEQVAQAGSWQWCPETGELRWSDNHFRIFGVEPGEVVPSTQLVLRLCHPDDRARLRLHLDDLARESTALPLEYRIVLPKGREVRYLRSTVASVDRTAARTLLIVGMVQDVTAARRAEREIASRVAVTSALTAWQSFEDGMEDLLGDLAGAIGACAGMAWLPDRGGLVAKAFWTADAATTVEFEVAVRNLRFPPGRGLPGRAWESMQPAAERTAGPECERREAAALAGIRRLVAVPIVHASELLAVVELATTEELPLTPRFVQSLTAIGYEIGEFLGHRRGELVPAALTARELEVLQLAAQGYSGRQIADRLRISPATIKTHFEHIYAKFGVRSRAAAVAQALRAGLIA